MPSTLLPMALTLSIAAAIQSFDWSLLKSASWMDGCPEMCACSTRGTIACTCDDNTSRAKADGSSQESTLVLKALGKHMAYVQQLAIHSCDRVVIAGRAFDGVAVVDLLKIDGVRELDIHSHAFAGIAKSPRQLIIQNSHASEIPPNAFTGLLGVDHFWWRNVSIGTIGRLAFADVSSIRYLYFRNAVVNRIESGAFARMRGVEQFYARGAIQLASIGDYLFVGSTLSEVIFEEADVHATDLTLVGLNAHHFQLLNSQWHSRRGKLAGRLPRQSLKQLHIKNSSVNRLIPSLLYNCSSLLVEKSRVASVQTIGRMRMLEGSVGKLHFLHSQVEHWHPRAIYRATGGRLSLVIEGCDIRRFHHHSVVDSELSEMLILHSTIGSLASAAFQNNTIGRIHLNKTRVASVGSEIFNCTSILYDLIISNVDVHSAGARLLAEIDIGGRIELLNSTFQTYPQLAFEGTEAAAVHIAHNTFFSSLRADFFHGLRARRFFMEECSYLCNESDCELNALLLHSTIHQNLAWRFADNRCLSNSPYDGSVGDEYEFISDAMDSDSRLRLQLNRQGRDWRRVRRRKRRRRRETAWRKGNRRRKAVCSEEHETIYQLDGKGGELVCRRRLLVMECICSTVGDDARAYVRHVPSTSAKILLIGDCDALSIREGGVESPDGANGTSTTAGAPLYLYVYRVDFTQVVELPPAIEELNILYSHVEVSPYATNNASELRELGISGSVIRSIGSHAFGGTRHLSLSVNNSEVDSIARDAFVGGNYPASSVNLINSQINSQSLLHLLNVRTINVENSQLPNVTINRLRVNECQPKVRNESCGGRSDGDHDHLLRRSMTKRCAFGADKKRWDGRAPEIRVDGSCWTVTESNPPEDPQVSSNPARRSTVSFLMCALCLLCHNMSIIYMRRR